MKKGDWYHSKDCKHVKNHKLFASCGHGSVVTQLANGMVKDNQKKVVQFATILHLLQQGCPMQKMKQLSHYMDSWQYQKIAKNIQEVITLVGQ